MIVQYRTLIIFLTELAARCCYQHVAHAFASRTSSWSFMKSQDMSMFKAKAAKASHSDVAWWMIDIALGAHPVRYNLFLPCVSDRVFFSESSWISCPGPQSQTSWQPDASNKENVDVDGCLVVVVVVVVVVSQWTMVKQTKLNWMAKSDTLCLFENTNILRFIQCSTLAQNPTTKTAVAKSVQYGHLMLYDPPHWKVNCNFERDPGSPCLEKHVMESRRVEHSWASQNIWSTNVNQESSSSCCGASATSSSSSSSSGGVTLLRREEPHQVKKNMKIPQEVAMVIAQHLHVA